MKAIVVDDIADLRKHLVQLINDVDGTVQVVAEAENVKQAVELIRKHQPEVVFLDVEMPGYSGLELFSFLKDEELQFETIFVTAHAHYAVKAFELSAVDYLLKPVTVDALKKALLKVSEQVKLKSSALQRYQTLHQQLGQPTVKTKIALSCAEAIRMVAYEDIFFLKANRAYTNFYLQTGDEILISKPLAEFEEILPPHFFVRIHRSYMVNLHHIKAYLKQENVVELANGEKLPVAADRKESLVQMLMK